MFNIVKDNCRLVSDVILKKKLDKFVMVVIGSKSSVGIDCLSYYECEIIGGEIISRELIFDKNGVDSQHDNNLDWLDSIVNNWWEGEFRVILCDFGV